MASHFMTVCVVCLLCVDHLHCHAHFITTDQKASDHLSRDQIRNGDHALQHPQNRVGPIDIIEVQHNKRPGRTKYPTTVSVAAANAAASKEQRIKRHSSHNDRLHDNDEHIHDNDHHQSSHDNSRRHNGSSGEKFIEKLFARFGDGDKMTMTLSEFEMITKQLRLYSLTEEENAPTSVINGGTNGLSSHSRTAGQHNSDELKQCISSVELIQRIKGTPTKAAETDAAAAAAATSKQFEGAVPNGANVKTPINSANVTTKANQSDNIIVTKDDFMSICPILLYHMTGTTSLEQSGCIDGDLLPAAAASPQVEDYIEDRKLVWIYASVSVLGVSLCGLFGVIVVPCMEYSLYNSILQFLVALAIGTLCGDALLHLLPHAMLSMGPDDDPHVSMTNKGLVAVLAIVFFFLTERGLTIISEHRKDKQKQEQPTSRVRVKREPDVTHKKNTSNCDHNSEEVDEKVCKSKYSSYPYCYDEIAMDTKDDHHQHNKTPMKHENNADTMANDDHCTDQSLLALSKKPETYPKLPTDDNMLAKGETGTVSKPYYIEDDEPVEENYTIILREHKSKHHGHSHTHGHVHSPPRNMSAVAWMVLMGDGLHNFTDGMTIGAAFSNNIAGGFSTSIAVFCHELPHELGDFAVLLKAGMTARQAVYYNLLSSLLSFIGMFFGVLLGETPEVSGYVFAAAAGLFIYIALVDMMPELTSTHKDHFALWKCVVQIAGMLTGLLAMYGIAMYEEDLKTIFKSAGAADHHHHHFHSHSRC